jgi:hypothetical protein
MTPRWILRCLATSGRSGPVRALQLLVFLIVCAAARAQPALTIQATPAAPINVALNKPYVYDPAPSYPQSTDPEDQVQLTDGLFSSRPGVFWTQKSTVGWVNARPVTVTIDLGSPQPIRGAGFSTAAGTAGVLWPAAIYILVSDDGKTFQSVGDLVVDSAAPPADGYHTFKYTTDHWQAHGRYVRFVVAGGGIFVFADELEVYAGDHAWLTTSLAGRPFTNTLDFLREARTQSGIRNRLTADSKSARSLLDAARLSPDVSAVLRTELDRIDMEIGSLSPTPIGTFKTILPLSDLHARIYAVDGKLATASGAKPVTAWAANPWDLLSPVTSPTDLPAAAGRVTVTTMHGETRAAAFNVANSTGEPVNASVRIDGLPGGGNPGYITVHDVVWTDTRSWLPVADALRPLAQSGHVYRFTISAGMTQQLFLSVKPAADVPAGSHQGRIVISAAGQPDEIVLPFALQVFDEVFPKDATLHVGGFDYLNRASGYAVTPENAASMLTTLRDHLVDSPWANGSVVPFGAFDAAGRLVKSPATDEFDRWIALWPGVNRYSIFIAATDRIGSVTAGSPSFERAVGEWITFWRQHAAPLGVKAEQLFFLIVDEPRTLAQDDRIVLWAKAIKAAEPKVMIWENPIYVDPTIGLPEMFRVSNVLVPPRELLLKQGRAFTNFYRTQQMAGRALELYSSKGPARLLDPYSYYRLQAWSCFQIGAAGSHFWAFGDTGGGSSWNEYALNGDAYTPLFIDPTSVTNSKHMEAIREGAEDFEYLVRLRDRVHATQQDNPAHKNLAHAVATLQTAAQRVLDADGAGGLFWTDRKDRGIADLVRIEIGEALAALK